ncbi:MAG: hypothetical protein IJQ44_02865 [Bacteroidaceae bacterium]|nr:hypothetical protein [Bacteroidaceae bacterium]
MKKTVYIAPALNVVRLNTENIIAVSGPNVFSDTAADDELDMEVKEDRGGWGDEW